MNIFRLYDNRKIYFINERRYVRLEELSSIENIVAYDVRGNDKTIDLKKRYLSKMVSRLDSALVNQLMSLVSKALSSEHKSELNNFEIHTSSFQESHRDLTFGLEESQLHHDQ